MQQTLRSIQPLVNNLTSARPTLELLWVVKGSPAAASQRRATEQGATPSSPLTALIFCCCLEASVFHPESNFKRDEGVIPDKRGIISLNDLYLATGHRVFLCSSLPSLVRSRLRCLSITGLIETEYQAWRMSDICRVEMKPNYSLSLKTAETFEFFVPFKLEMETQTGNRRLCIQNWGNVNQR